MRQNLSMNLSSPDVSTVSPVVRSKLCHVPGPAPGHSEAQPVQPGHTGSLSRLRHRTLAYGVNKTDLDSATGADKTSHHVLEHIK